MSGITAAAPAITFVWLGMVLAISFLEAPLKFRAPGITTQLGLGIGRLVFRALNAIESVLAIALVATVAVGRPGPVALVGVGAAVAVLVVQVAAVRPRLKRRADAVLATTEAVPGGMRDRSRAHYAYAGLEVVKVVALLTAGIALQMGLISG